MVAPAFSSSALYSKSKVFIERALAERNSGDFAGYQLWASLSLELLAKAALAGVHPTLVADPSSFESLLAACDHPFGVSSKSIPAKTAYERLNRVAKDFDKSAMDFSMILAIRRNEELHSGAVPYEGINLQSWIPRFWRTAKIVLNAQHKGLAEWIGDAEAEGAEGVIAEAQTALEQAVMARIVKHHTDFDVRYPEGSSVREMIEAEATFSLSQLAALPDVPADSADSIECPACHNAGALLGDQWYQEEETEQPDPEEPPVLKVTTCFKSVAFRCFVCGLKLNGQEELEIADLPDTFETLEEKEPDYSGEYYNE